MWDAVQVQPNPLSREMPCPGCGHAIHTYLPCSDACACIPTWLRLDKPRVGIVHLLPEHAA